MRATSRSAELLEAAVEDALTHGITGLSLRPLAARLGTSDRMLLYHFESKDELVAALIEATSDRATQALRELPAADSPGAAVLSLWRLYRRPDVAACMRVYIQAAAMGLLGSEPYRTAARRSNHAWTQAVCDHLEASGAAATTAQRAGELVDAALFGLTIDEPLDDQALDQLVADLASAVEQICWERATAGHDRAPGRGA